jgi:hypothetical protein
MKASLDAGPKRDIHAATAAILPETFLALALNLQH